MHALSHTHTCIQTNDRGIYRRRIQPHAPPPPAVRTSTAVTLLWWLPICIIRACACTYICSLPVVVVVVILSLLSFILRRTAAAAAAVREECVVAITSFRRPVVLRFTIYYFIIIYIYIFIEYTCMCDDEFVITHDGSCVKTIPFVVRRSHVLRYRYALATARDRVCVCV